MIFKRELSHQTSVCDVSANALAWANCWQDTLWTELCLLRQYHDMRQSTTLKKSTSYMAKTETQKRNCNRVLYSQFMHVKPFLYWVGRYLCFSWSLPFFSSLSTSGSASGCSGTSTTRYDGSLYISTFKIIVRKAQALWFVKLIKLYRPNE